MDRSKEPQELVNNGGNNRSTYNILVFVSSSLHKKHVRFVNSVQPQYSAAESGSIVIHDDDVLLLVVVVLVVPFGRNSASLQVKLVSGIILLRFCSGIGL